MSFFEQLVRLLTEPPGSLVYQLVTLFAIQAALAMAYWQWRRERLTGERDAFAWRLLLASGGLLGIRLLSFVVALVMLGSEDTLAALRILPPLNQALTTGTIVLLAWAVVPPLPGMPRLSNALAILLLLLTGILLISFSQSWARQVAPGVTYNSTVQATFWSVLQLLVSGGAILWLALRPAFDRGLRLALLGVMFLAALAHLWSYPEIIESVSEISYWLRLGQLIALPLLAVLAFRHTVGSLLVQRQGQQPHDDLETPDLLRAAVRVVGSVRPERAAREALLLVADVLPVDLVALAVLDREIQQTLEIYVVDRLRQDVLVRSGWSLERWVSMRLALEQEERVELRAGGMGAYQLQELASALGMVYPQHMLIVPILRESGPLGFLLLGQEARDAPWPERVERYLPLSTELIGAALETAHQATAEAEAVVVAPASNTGQLVLAEEARDQALAEVARLKEQVVRAEAAHARDRQRVAELTLAVATLERSLLSRKDTAALEEEVAALREALIEAEEAMAMIAAKEGGVSTEWVTRTITRYSGELETAQARITELEKRLAEQEPWRNKEVLVSLLQELRTPLTSIEGYTGLLLTEMAGIVDSQQRDFLQRIQANAERLHLLLEQGVQYATDHLQPRNGLQPVDVREEVESAISMVMSQFREKQLMLNLDLDAELPAIELPPNDLCQIVVHLLSNATQASEAQTQVTLSAHKDAVTLVGAEGELEERQFLHLLVRDKSGGIDPEDLAHVFDPQVDAEKPLISGLGDTSAGLSLARGLVAANGGRMWVDSQPGKGSTFTVLLPLVAGGSVNGDG